MATEKWIGGSLAGLTWADAFTSSTLNSIASGNSIRSDLTLDNSSTLDVFADFSIFLASLNTAVPNYIGIYIYPMNQDGSTFGDNRFASSFSAVPAPQYWVANMVCLFGGPGTQVGQVRGILLPPGQFKFVINNQLGVAMNASGNIAKYRTYNRQVT